MIGDRFLTDVAFGNRLGMLTIRPEPFTSEGETKAVRAVSFFVFLKRNLNLVIYSVYFQFR